MPDTDGPTSAPQSLVITIDHAGARVSPVGREAGTAPQALHHLQHEIDRTQHDADRDKAYPADLPHSTVPQLLALARHALWPALKSAGTPAG